MVGMAWNELHDTLAKVLAQIGVRAGQVIFVAKRKDMVLYVAKR